MDCITNICGGRRELDRTNNWKAQVRGYLSTRQSGSVTQHRRYVISLPIVGQILGRRRSLVLRHGWHVKSTTVATDAASPLELEPHAQLHHLVGRDPVELRRRPRVAREEGEEQLTPFHHA